MTSKSSATEFFNTHAAAYTEHATWANDTHLNAAVAHIVNEKHPTTIVDFGVGSGQLLSLFPQVKHRIGIDLSIQMLVQIRDASIHRILGDIHDVALRTSSVDFVLCRQVLHYCHVGRVLGEADRILRDVGYALVVHVADDESIPAKWYAEWNALKRIKERKHLTISAILNSAREEGFDVELEGRYAVRIALRWNDLFQKYAAAEKHRQLALSRFFCGTPDPIARAMGLEANDQGVSYRRVFACLLLRKAAQCSTNR